MSDSPFRYAFPQRTPVFTTVLVLLCFALFGWLALRYYVPRYAPERRVEGVRTPAERKALLAEVRGKEQAAVGSYAWLDRDAGRVRLPVQRAMELTVRDLAKK